MAINASMNTKTRTVVSTVARSGKLQSASGLQGFRASGLHGLLATHASLWPCLNLQAWATRSGWRRWRTNEKYMRKVSLSSRRRSSCRGVLTPSSQRLTGQRHWQFSYPGSIKRVQVGSGSSNKLWLRLPWPVVPNPSFKPSPNGVPRGPGWRYAVHFRHPGPRVTPLVPA